MSVPQRALKMGVICSPVPGHLTPLCSLGRALKARGHEVIFFNVADVKDFIESEGHRFVQVGESRFPKGAWQKWMEPLSKKKGLAVVMGTSRLNTLLAEIYCDEIPLAAQAEGVDLFVVDQIQFPGKIIAQSISKPFVSVACALRLNRELDRAYPPPFVGWYGETSLHRILNQAAFRAFDYFCSPILKVANRNAKLLGLSPLKNADQSYSPLLELYPMARSFDFPVVGQTQSQVFVGPYLDSKRAPVAFDFDQIDGERLIYASLGTLQNGVESLFKSIIRSFRLLPEFHLVLSLGRIVTETEKTWLALTENLPTNVTVVPFAPQLEMIKRAEAVITHAGMNTTMEALAQAKPLLAIPIANDQPAVAARIRARKLGIVLSPSQATPKAIADSVRALVGTHSYAENARAQAADIGAAGGAQRAAELIEAAYGVN